MATTSITSREQFAALLADGFERTAQRLELQAHYDPPGHAELLARFVAGSPVRPDEEPGAIGWFVQVRRQVNSGKRIERVRVLDEPPSDYQRYEQWHDRWNAAAGERIAYLTRSRAYEIGLLPPAGAVDWWLFDAARLLTMEFDGAGRRGRTELTDDPDRVAQANTWWDLAVRHAVPLTGTAVA